MDARLGKCELLSSAISLQLVRSSRVHFVMPAAVFGLNNILQKKSLYKLRNC